MSSALLLTLALCVPARETPPAADTVVLTGAHVLSLDGVSWLEEHAVVVRAGKIEAITPTDELDFQPGTVTIDLSGLYLVPGLIDLHSHLLLHPYDEASWEHQVLKESLELRTVRGVRAARATLEAGFTTIRELGTEGAGYADVALRDAIDAGIVVGPRVVTATRALVATGCYGPSGFDPRWDVPKGAQVADGPVELRIAVREQIAAGADWIKVYADYRRKPGDASTPTYSQEELDAIVAEATSAGVPVAAHASTDEAIRRAVRAGVKTIEHGTDVSDQTLALMRDQGVALCPTLTANESIARYTGWDGSAPDPPRIRRAKDMFARALRSGVTIACGSDVGVFAHGDNVRELELMRSWGMTAPDALRSATSVAAEVLGREAELGRIAPGALADLVAVRADPLEEVTALRRPSFVMKDGRVALDRRYEADGAAETQILALCNGMLDAYSHGRFDEVAGMFAPHAVVALDLQADDLQATLSAEEFVERGRRSVGDADGFAEWLSGEARVLIDGKIACVWAPFALETDGRRSTGTDVFQLVRLAGGWKIASLSFTNRPL